MATENRRYLRVPPRGQVTNQGKIIVDPKRPAIDCTVLDLSAGGARLSVNAAMSLPSRFEFLHGGVKRKCTLVWHRGYRLGVSY